MNNRSGFWELFAENAEAIRNRLAEGKTRVAFNEVEALLTKFGLEFSFDLTMIGNRAVLILTPEGDWDLAKEIDELIREAREIPNWEVYGRRQKKELSDVFEILKGIYGEDAQDALFSVRRLNGKYEVIMHTQAVKGYTEAEANGFVATFLDHAVGEEIVMSKVGRMAASSDFPSEGSYSSEEVVSLFVHGVSS
jgi:hypothetical protein